MTLGRDWSRPLGASGSRRGGGTVSWSVWDYLGLGIGAGCGTECPSSLLDRVVWDTLFAGGSGEGRGS